MSRVESRTLVWPLAAFLGIWVILGQVQGAAANLSYRMYLDAKENDEGRVIQSIDHRLTFSLGQQLTERLSASENINYNNRWQQEGTPKETVASMATLVTNGDIFLASLSVNSLQDLDSHSSQATSDTLAVALASTWEKRLLPHLRANYDYSQQQRDGGGGLTKGSQQGMGGEVDWNLILAKAFYSYRYNISKLQSYEVIQDNHLAKVTAERVWLDNRLRLSLAHEYGEDNNERRFNFNTFTEVAFPVNPIEVRTGQDPDLADNLEGDLILNPDMLNGGDDPLSPPAFNAISPKNINNCLLLVTKGLPVDHLYLYTQENFINSPSGVTWQVYTKDRLESLTWTRVGIATPTYDRVNQRFVFLLPALTAIYIKIVVNVDTAVPISFTEVRADQIVHGAIGSTRKIVSKSVDSRSNFSFDFKLTDFVAFAYSGQLASDKLDGVTITEGENHNTGLRMQNYSGDLKSNLSFSLSKNSQKNDPELQTRVYHLDVKKDFLPTLSAALGGSHEEASQSGVLLFDRNSYTFYADARFYPDLTSRVNVSYSEQQNYNSTTGNGANDALYSQYGISLRYSPSLSFSLTESYNEQNQDGELSSQQNALSISSNWRVSEILSLNGTVQKLDSKFDGDGYSYTADMSAGLGAGLELKGRYTRREGEITAQSGQASLNWTSGSYVSWEVGCLYADSELVEEANIFKAYGRLQVSFATR